MIDDKTKALLDRAPEIVAALRHCPVVECAHCAFAGEECKLGEQAAILIEAYAAENAQLREQLAAVTEELLKAEKEGRCVVLDGPRKPLIWDDDHEAIRCAYCGTDLMGIPYGERMALQCPECGEYIDATKTITRAEAEAALEGKQ